MMELKARSELVGKFRGHETRYPVYVRLDRFRESLGNLHELSLFSRAQHLN